MSDYITKNTSSMEVPGETGEEIRRNIRMFHAIRDKFFDEIERIYNKKIDMVRIEWVE